MTKKEDLDFKKYRRGFWFLIVLIIVVTGSWMFFSRVLLMLQNEKHDFEVQLYQKDIDLYRKDVTNLYNQFAILQNNNNDNSLIPITAYIYAPEVQVSPYNYDIPDIYPFPRTDNNRITQLFAIRKHPITGQVSFHTGLDMVTTYQGVILVTADGQVTECGRDRFYGNYVIVKHGTYYTLYAHLLEFYAHKFEMVTKGQFIGRMGDTGYSEGAHLHYEIFTITVDPQTKKEIRNYLDPISGSGEENFHGLQGYLNMEYIAGVNGIFVESIK